MKRFKIRLTRKVEQWADVNIEATSPNKARTIAEYEANRIGIESDWETAAPDKPFPMRSKIIGEDSTGK